MADADRTTGAQGGLMRAVGLAACLALSACAPPPQEPAAVAASVEALWREPPMSIVAQEMPAEARRIRQGFNGAGYPTLQARRNALMAQASQVDVGHYRDLARAPDEELWAWIVALARSRQAMRTRQPDRCSATHTDLDIYDDPQVSVAFWASFRATLRGIRAGQERPVVRPAATRADAAVLMPAMRAAATTPEALNVLLRGPAAGPIPPQVACELQFTQTIAMARIPREVAVRITATQLLETPGQAGASR